MTCSWDLAWQMSTGSTWASASPLRWNVPSVPCTPRSLPQAEQCARSLLQTQNMILELCCAPPQRAGKGLEYSLGQEHEGAWS